MFPTAGVYAVFKWEPCIVFKFQYTLSQATLILTGRKPRIERVGEIEPHAFLILVNSDSL